METLSQVTSYLMENIFPHWPGLFFIIFITILAQNLKSRLLTKEFASKNKTIFWSRRVYPILLLLLGILPGLLWPGEIYSGIDTRVEKIFYFMGCSGISILGFNIFKQWVKKKYDIDVEEEIVDEKSVGVGEETSSPVGVILNGNSIVVTGSEVREGQNIPLAVPVTNEKGGSETSKNKG